MRLRLSIALCSVLAVPSSGASSPQERAKEKAWTEQIKAAQKARTGGDWASAHKALQKALELAEGLEQRARRVPETLDSLAWLYQAQWRYPEAVTACEQAVEIRALHSNTPLLGSGYCNYGLDRLYEQVEAWDKAEAHVRQRIEQLEGSSQDSDSKIGSQLRNLARLLRKFRPDDPEIETLLLRVRGLVRDREDEAGAMSSLGFYYAERGLHEEAATAFAEALEMEQSLDPEADHSSRLITLARQYRALGEHHRAVELMRSAIEVRTAHLGPGDITVTDPVFRLGRLLAEQGKYEEAEPYLRRAVEATDEALGEDHMGYEYQRRELRRVLVALGRVAEEGDEEEDCECPYDRARVRELIGLGRGREALVVLKDGLAQAEALYGHDSLEVASVLDRIGSIEAGTNPVGAIETYERGLSILERELSLENRRIANTAGSLSHLYKRTRDFDEATHYRLKQVESLRAAGGREFSLAEALEDLANVRTSAGDQREALEYYRLAAGIWATYSGKDSAKYSEVQVRIAWCLVFLDRSREAETGLLKLLQGLEAQFSPSPYQLRSAWTVLARVYSDTGRETKAREAKNRAASY